MDVISNHNNDISATLKNAGLRPTEQRVGLYRIMFAKGDRHITPEQLFNEANGFGFRVSLATVYNNLNAFKDAGLVKEVVIRHGQSYFDTNTDDHHHLYIEDNKHLVDIPAHSISIHDNCAIPEGKEVAFVSAIVHLRDKR